MVRFLLTLDDKRYDDFCICLEETGQGHVVEAYLKVTDHQPDQGATGISLSGKPSHTQGNTTIEVYIVKSTFQKLCDYF